jgi:hypothetical protein
MIPETFAPHIQALQERALPDGSFSVSPRSGSRPDATAWAAIALHLAGQAPELVRKARASLAARQQTDGGVPLLEGSEQIKWPTPLALLAWLPDADFRRNAEAATEHLLTHSGEHKLEDKGDIVGHDTSLRGWPWIYGTHSWVEPTSIVLLALRAAGKSQHERALEATRMLLNRQLPEGGWNYGNTRVFRNTLLPTPESTGHALAGLIDLATKDTLAKSISFLQGPEGDARTPLTASWRVLGLSAWGEPPADANDAILQALQRQERYGPYDTPLLAQLLTAVHGVALFQIKGA